MAARGELSTGWEFRMEGFLAAVAFCGAAPANGRSAGSRKKK